MVSHADLASFALAAVLRFEEQQDLDRIPCLLPGGREPR